MPTYTSVWRMERKLYKIHDLELPRPIAAGEAAAFVLFALTGAVLLTKTGVGFNQWTGPFLFIVPPVVLTWWVRRPVADAKTLPAWLATQTRALAEPKILDTLAPRREPAVIRVRSRIRITPHTREGDRRGPLP